MPCDRDEQIRRLQVLWRGKAQDFLADIRPRTPPSGWAFVTTLENFLRARQLDQQIKYDEDEATDWRSFRAWYTRMSEDLHNVVELLEDYERWPCDADLQQRLIDRGHELKSAYQIWYERGAIKWLPEEHAIKSAHGRNLCTVIEYATHALIAHERTERTPSNERPTRDRASASRTQVPSVQGKAPDPTHRSRAQAGTRVGIAPKPDAAWRLEP